MDYHFFRSMSTTIGGLLCCFLSYIDFLVWSRQEKTSEWMHLIKQWESVLLAWRMLRQNTVGKLSKLNTINFQSASLLGRYNLACWSSPLRSLALVGLTIWKSTCVSDVSLVYCLNCQSSLFTVLSLSLGSCRMIFLVSHPLSPYPVQRPWFLEKRSALFSFPLT